MHEQLWHCYTHGYPHMFSDVNPQSCSLVCHLLTMWHMRRLFQEYSHCAHESSLMRKTVSLMQMIDTSTLFFVVVRNFSMLFFNKYEVLMADQRTELTINCKMMPCDMVSSEPWTKLKHDIEHKHVTLSVLKQKVWTSSAMALPPLRSSMQMR